MTLPQLTLNLLITPEAFLNSLLTILEPSLKHSLVIPSHISDPSSETEYSSSLYQFSDPFYYLTNKTTNHSWHETFLFQ